MSKILKKRESLERFIREQTIGPGIGGYRFVNLSATFNVDQNFLIEAPLNNSFEILNTMPASVYSTGILFPKDESESAIIGLEYDANTNDNEDNEENDNLEQLKINTEDIESRDSLELNQMFPQTMGLTFCMKEDFLVGGNLNFKVKSRYYKKLKNNDLENIAVLCENEVNPFREFLDANNLSAHFSIVDFGVNKCLKATHKLTNYEIKSINQILKSIDENRTKEIFEKEVKPLLSSSLTFIPKSLSSLLQTIFSDLKNKIVDVDNRNKLYQASQKIEILENYKSHIKDLINLYSRDTIWIAISLEAEISLANIMFENGGKRTYLAGKSYSGGETVEVIRNDNTKSNSLQHIFKVPLNEKENEFASLSANVQLSRDSRSLDNKTVFIKIQLINDSSSFKKDTESKRYYSVATENVNNRCFFGVKIEVKDKNIIPYTDYSYKKDKKGAFDEDTTTKFIYNQFKDYAIGHGCSINWVKIENEVQIETEYIPECETPDIEPIPRDKSKKPIELSNGEISCPPFSENSKPQEFKWLSNFSNTTNEEIISGLVEFVDSYGKWIEQKLDNSLYQGDFKDIASQELSKCKEDYLRMKTNITTLLSGETKIDNLKSFRLMNAAMFMQLFHTEKVKSKDITELISEENWNGFNLDFYKNADDKLFSKTESAGWRAFQLAFILLNLDGVFKGDNDSDWTARNKWVDLVWFPTGGGKTEAYLGLIALTIINRRKLHKEKGGGVAAIMRYTLRLLTMQQFQRATLVIMALELIRRWDENTLGKEPITIGLWVGDNSLPNNISNIVNGEEQNSLISEFNKLRANQPNKIPFSTCPWCSSKLRPMPEGGVINDANDIYNNGKANLYCDNNKCSFTQPNPFKREASKGPMPVNLCDDSIYQHPPSLLFGTVDKFAQLAHKVDINNNQKDSRRLFGRGSWEIGKPRNGYLPPDLIIQDELHLLLGPLGSAVALFETAVDHLCKRDDGTRPKIISSTATTRNTQLQIAAIFGRKVNLFPKPGVECDDSFFAFYKRKFDNQETNNSKYIAKRKYVGILPTGRTQIWMQMRLAAILMTHRVIFELQELVDNQPIEYEKYDKELLKAMDYYHTVISYFNSLKEVGKTQSQVQTYILKEFRRVFNRVLRPQKLMHALYTYGPIHEAELTGRLSGEEVKTELKNVESKFEVQKRFAHLVKEKDNLGNEIEKLASGKVPPEFLVATNMISVGIDVSRFNTIIVNSMPRNTAEYIQASSRVARDKEGLVITIHHPFRARDISHYEKFIEFHEKMYSYVEPISITPFTKKAIERYLGLYLATMIRHTRSDFNNKDSAGNISILTAEEVTVLQNDLNQEFKFKKSSLEEFDSHVKNLLKEDNISQIEVWIKEAIEEWKNLAASLDKQTDLVFNRATNRDKQQRKQEQLYVDIEAYEGTIHSKKWQVPMSLRVIEPEAAIKINSI